MDTERSYLAVAWRVPARVRGWGAELDHRQHWKEWPEELCTSDTSWFGQRACQQLPVRHRKDMSGRSFFALLGVYRVCWVGFRFHCFFNVSDSLRFNSSTASALGDIVRNGPGSRGQMCRVHLLKQ